MIITDNNVLIAMAESNRIKMMDMADDLSDRIIELHIVSLNKRMRGDKKMFCYIIVTVMTVAPAYLIEKSIKTLYEKIV